MGYTQYFYSENRNQEFTDEEFYSFASDVQKIINRADVKIAGPDGTGKPIVTAEEVAFNGSEEDRGDFEVFEINKNGIDNWGFCKTGHRPYDVVVVASIIAAKKAFGDKIKVGSDAQDEYMLSEGIELYKNACGLISGNSDWQTDINNYLSDVFDNIEVEEL
jgi:hypothetical protein